MERNGKLNGVTYQTAVSLLEREIDIQMYETQNGICVTIAGGDRGHIGALAFSAPDTEPQSVTFPGHKETVVCERWVKGLGSLYSGPVVVVAGIHYDRITKEQIQKVLDAMDSELAKAMEYLRARKAPSGP